MSVHCTSHMLIIIYEVHINDEICDLYIAHSIYEIAFHIISLASLHDYQTRILKQHILDNEDGKWGFERLG